MTRQRACGYFPGSRSPGIPGAGTKPQTFDPLGNPEAGLGTSYPMLPYLHTLATWNSFHALTPMSSVGEMIGLKSFVLL